MWYWFTDFASKFMEKVIEKINRSQTHKRLKDLVKSSQAKVRLKLDYCGVMRMEHIVWNTVKNRQTTCMNTPFEVPSLHPIGNQLLIGERDAVCSYAHCPNYCGSLYSELWDLLCLEHTKLRHYGSLWFMILFALFIDEYILKQQRLEIFAYERILFSKETVNPSGDPN